MNYKLPVIELAAVAVCAAIYSAFLFVQPVIGLADNGDFGRIMASTQLEYIDPSSAQAGYFGYMNREYLINVAAGRAAGYFTSQILLVELSKLLNRLVSGSRIFDIRYLSFLYLLVILWAVFLITRYAGDRDRPLPKLVLAVLVTFVFTDAGYACYLNSLYGEAVSLSFLLLTAAAALLMASRQIPRLSHLCLFFLAGVVLAAAKAQNAPLGILLSAFLFRLRSWRPDRHWRLLAAGFAAAMLLTSAASFLSVPGPIKTCNKYHTVFYGIIKDSKTPEKDLEELGLDPSLSILAGTDYFDRNPPIDPTAPEMTGEINRGISHLKVLKFYARHPGRFLSKLEVTARNAFVIMPGYGNYEKGDDTPFGKSAYSLSLWGRFKKEFLPNTLVFVLLQFFAFAAFSILAVLRLSGRHSYRTSAGPRQGIAPVKIRRLELLALFTLTALVLFVVPVLGDGEADLAKHLFLFNASFDLMFVLTLASIAGLSANLQRKAAFNEKNRL